MKSIRDIYKIGTGPSSSHTMGPTAAAKDFSGLCPGAERYRAVLYGSLSKTGSGHGTDRAIMAALAPHPCEVEFSLSDPEKLRHPNTIAFIAGKEKIIGYSCQCECAEFI